MSVQVMISEAIVQGRNPSLLQEAVTEGILVRDYVMGEISLGEFAQFMKISYIEARNWLHKKGINTTASFQDPNLEAIAQENRKKLMENANSSQYSPSGV